MIHGIAFTEVREMECSGKCQTPVDNLLHACCVIHAQGVNGVAVPPKP